MAMLGFERVCFVQERERSAVWRQGPTKRAAIHRKVNTDWKQKQTSQE